MFRIQIQRNLSSESEKIKNIAYIRKNIEFCRSLIEENKAEIANREFEIKCLEDYEEFLMEEWEKEIA